MALPKERVVYVALLSLAAGGFVVDRMFFGFTDAPSSARADAGSDGAGEPHKSVAPPPQPVIALTATQKASADLATRLRGLGVADTALDRLDDPFSVRVAPSADEHEAAQAVPTIAPPPPLPTVTAVLIGSTPTIVANGKRLRLGESIGPWKVVAIAAEAVTFDCGGVIAELPSPVVRFRDAH